MQVELDFYSDQVNTGRSIYPQLEKEYTTSLMSLSQAVQQAEAGDGTVTDSSPSNMPSWGFPEAQTGWGTHW
jgi:hypothetical protein